MSGADTDLIVPGVEEEVRLGNLAGLVGYRLRRASGAMDADFLRSMEGTGMRPVLFGMLSVIDANPGISQSMLGRTLGVQRANMVPLANDLVDRGLVERRMAPNDKRAFALRLTDTGRALLGECLGRVHSHEGRALEKLSPAERTQLLDLLAKIRLG